MTITMSLSPVDIGVNVLEITRGMTLALQEDIPDDAFCHRPGGNANHAAWILGHIAVSDDFFLTTLGHKPSAVPAPWPDLFGTGSSPTNNLADYPDRRQLLDGLARSRDAVLHWFLSLSDDELSAPLEGDMQQFAPNAITLMSTLAMHEGVHAGQLIEVRRSLALPRKFG